LCSKNACDLIVVMQERPRRLAHLGGVQLTYRCRACGKWSNDVLFPHKKRGNTHPQGEKGPSKRASPDPANL